MMCIVNGKEYSKEQMQEVMKLYDRFIEAAKAAWNFIKEKINHIINSVITYINNIVDHANEKPDDFTNEELGELARLVGIKRLSMRY